MPVQEQEQEQEQQQECEREVTIIHSMVSIRQKVISDFVSQAAISELSLPAQPVLNVALARAPLSLRKHKKEIEIEEEEEEEEGRQVQAKVGTG